MQGAYDLVLSCAYPTEQAGWGLHLRLVPIADGEGRSYGVTVPLDPSDPEGSRGRAVEQLMRLAGEAGLTRQAHGALWPLALGRAMAVALPRFAYPVDLTPLQYQDGDPACELPRRPAPVVIGPDAAPSWLHLSELVPRG